MQRGHAGPSSLPRRLRRPPPPTAAPLPATAQAAGLQQQLAEISASPLLGLQDAADTLAEQLAVDHVRCVRYRALRSRHAARHRQAAVSFACERYVVVEKASRQLPAAAAAAEASPA